MGDVNHISNTFKTLATNAGAELYEIDLRKICPKETVRLKCQVPLCEFYEVCKVCPPNIPSVMEFREALKDYSKAFLVVLKEKIKSIDVYRNDFRAELKLGGIVSQLELAAFRLGYYLALGLCVGGCKLCPECAPPGEPCRHPFRARPSPEGFGIDVTEVAREAGVPIEWPPTEQVCFMGLVFV